MSQIMEKTLASIPQLLTQSLIGGGSSKTQQRQVPSMEVQMFMKNVHRARSKSHEMHIVTSELFRIEEKLKQIDLASSTVIVRSCFAKVLFCHLLGYNVNFAAIHFINLAQQGRGFDKRLGYLMSCILFNPQHELVLLMVGTILGDLKIHNISNNCVALKVAGELANEEVVPFVLPEVIKKFNHDHDLVKEKAIHCFGALCQRYPTLLQSEIGRLSSFLTSRDPGILMAVMNVFVTLTTEDPSKFVKLGSSFLHILDQINNRGFGSSYYYHMIPLPWLQIALLKVIGNIGRVDSHLSANVCPLLKNLIEKTKVSVPISLAVLVESILTATKINPNEALVQLCSRCIMKLLASDSSEDMRYQGLGLLIALSRIKPSIVSQHQAAIIDCLTNEDHSIQSRTTYLLHAMANRANVKAICSKLFEQLEKTTDLIFQQDILMMISDLAQRLSPDIDWYISINLNILSHDLPQRNQDKVADNVLRTIEGISGPNQLVDETGVKNLTKTLFSVVEQHNYASAEFSLSIRLFGILAPILPEEFSSVHFLELVGQCLCNSCDNNSDKTNVVTMYSPDDFTDKNKLGNYSDKNLIKLKSQCLMTVSKLVLYQCIQPVALLDWVDSLDYKENIKNSFLHSDLDDLQHLARNPQDLRMKSAVFVQDCQEIDFSLSFLDSYVLADLLKGNDCYKPQYVKEQERSQLQNSLSSLSMSDMNEDGIGAGKISLSDSVMSDSQTSQISRKIPSKWRDDDQDDDGDDVNEDEWNRVGENSSSLDKFILINPDDKYLVELNKKKKAAEELFAGLDESNFIDIDSSLSPSSTTESFSSPQTKHGKSIWDDEDDNVNVKHGIFNVGGIGIHPFGISKSKKPAVKSAHWNEEIGAENLSNTDDIGIPTVSPLGNLNDNNDYDEFDDSFSESHHSTLYYSKSGLPDNLWSDDKVGFSVAEEAVLVSDSNAKAEHGHDSLVNSSDGLSTTSTVDALTDSDPETA